MIDRKNAQIGIIEQERRRRLGLSPDEREAEDYALACQLAASRDDPRPDREAHRAAWRERNGIASTTDTGSGR